MVKELDIKDLAKVFIQEEQKDLPQWTITVSNKLLIQKTTVRLKTITPKPISSAEKLLQRHL